ncbi:MAG: flagellar basal body P-ring protein FlgI, partial [Methylotenera sp.]|nr:flagellar basal body P-ring protein FlgI [Methylotenera sp.]
MHDYLKYAYYLIYKNRLDSIFVLFLCSLVFIQPAHAERLKDLATIQGVRNNQLMGYGLVVGLDGTGDQTPYTVQSMISMMQQMGINLPAGTSVQMKNVASVIITSSLPAFAQPGQTLDVT